VLFFQKVLFIFLLQPNFILSLFFSILNYQDDFVFEGSFIKTLITKFEENNILVKKSLCSKIFFLMAVISLSNNILYFF